MAELLPRLAIAVPGADEVVVPASLFPRAVSEVWLEIGFGGGEHVAEQVRRHPDVGIIGCEVFLNGVASLLGHLNASGIDTVRIFPEDARLLLPALPEASLGRVFVLFPDPWPKKRHAERRFIGPANLAALARVMADGAELRVASDDPVYVEWALGHLGDHPAFTARQITQERAALPDDWPPTRYERKLLAGYPPTFMRFCRKPRT
ncbi:MAG: tRNA (guanine(46)-N(7))-methyltransferase TrmB [Magnetospirillum sp.]|nr:tRNA (guanine(46)-N(7))-methyltransferase TrmB [Magnetospirillum sp.]